MQKANSANEYVIRRHRLIEEHEFIRFQDPHCPVSIIDEENISCIASEEIISLEAGDTATH